MLEFSSMLAPIKKFKYLELIRELALTGFKLKYHGSLFGYLWSLMKPLFLFIVLYTVFSKVFDLGRSIENYPIYLLIGITLWTFFMETTSMCMGIVVGSGDLIRKVYFPRIVLPIATSLTSFITLMLNLGIVFGFMLYLKVPIGIEVLYLIPLLIQFYVFTLGVSLFLSSVFVKFRDIAPIWEVFAQALFYGTPILYSLAAVPGWAAKFIMVSPLAQIIQSARAAILPTEVITAKDILGNYSFVPLLIVVLVFILGYTTFNKMTARFAEEV